MSEAGGSGRFPGGSGAAAPLRGRQVKNLSSFAGTGFRRIKPFSNVTRYGHAVGRIRVLEMRLLNSQRLERLIDADFEGALNILDEIDMGDYLASAKLARDVDADLTDFLRHVYSSLAEALPRDSVIMDFFLCRYDFHNLKALLKARLGEEEPQGLLEGLGAIFHINTVPEEIWFDNAKTIVTKIIQGGGRKITERFDRFSEHCRFQVSLLSKIIQKQTAHPVHKLPEILTRKETQKRV